MELEKIKSVFCKAQAFIIREPTALDSQIFVFLHFLLSMEMSNVENIFLWWSPSLCLSSKCVFWLNIAAFFSHLWSIKKHIYFSLNLLFLNFQPSVNICSIWTMTLKIINGDMWVSRHVCSCTKETESIHYKN